MKRKKKGIRRRSYSPRPRKPKSYWEVIQLKGKEYTVDESTGMTMELYDRMEDQMITLDDLLTKFYRIHLKQDNHDERLNPIAFKLLDDKNSPFKEKMWVAPMYGGFFIQIIINSRGKTGGPHQCQLWFKSFTTHKCHWIATLQLMVFFFNQKQMIEALMLATENREFYMAEAEKKKGLVP